jgi:SAM-dependent methyltransferase
MTIRTFAAPGQCDVCGHPAFEHTRVLWDELVSAWELSDEEAAYIDAQQGVHCAQCGSNLRSIALARALMRVRGFDGLLTAFVQDGAQSGLRLLELNEAGTLHPLLKLLPGHRLMSYPEVDMMHLPLADASCDVVIHSDTLEHVPDPARGLEECRRVLAPAGALVFTVPTVIGRLTRGRAGLPPSYHGAEHMADGHMLVHTEFGADVWAMVLTAGFASCELVPFAFPAGLAIVARR